MCLSLCQVDKHQSVSAYPVSLSIIPRTHMVARRTASYKLPSDLYMCAVARTPPQSINHECKGRILKASQAKQQQILWGF